MRLFLAIISLCLYFASAQSKTNVDIRLPVVLKLSLDGQVLKHEGQVPLNILVKDGVYEISPEQTHLKVLSNTTWQLTIQILQVTPETPRFNLKYRLDEHKQWKQIHAYAQEIRQGRGRINAEMTIHYGFSQLPPDGRYQAVVSYTLSNP